MTKKKDTAPLSCEAVEGAPVPHCKVYNAAERAAWERQNRFPPPPYNAAAYRFWKARRMEAARVAAIAEAHRRRGGKEAA